jgi:hypothetical protein
MTAGGLHGVRQRAAGLLRRPGEESLTRMGMDLAWTNNPFDIRGWWLERMSAC